MSPIRPGPEPGGEGGLPFELYRQERIGHRQLAEALGLSRYETDGVLKRHKVWLELTPEELAAQAALLRDVRPE